MGEPRHDIAIRVRDLAIGFGRELVLDGVDLDVYRGEILGVVGATGSGKSVLLRTVIGLLKPWRGTVQVLGQPIHELDEAAREKVECSWGVMFQNGALFGSLTVAQNVEVPLYEHTRLSRRLIDEIAAVKIDMVGLEADAGPKFPAELSGGMRKRTALARALALDPEILFLDEPTAGLDPIGAAAFDRLLRDLHQSLGLTVFLVTHDLDSLRAVCERIAVLAEKRVIVTGTMDDMVRHDHPWVREYFTGPRGRAAWAAAG